MKRLFVLAVVLLVSAGGLYLAQRRKHADVVSTIAMVDAAADWQRDLTRAPMHFTRISDESEVCIGDQLAQQYIHGQRDLTPEKEATEKYVNALGSRVAAN